MAREIKGKRITELPDYTGGLNGFIAVDSASKKAGKLALSKLQTMLGGGGDCNLFVGSFDTKKDEWLEAYRSGKELRFKGLGGLVPEELMSQLGDYIAPDAINGTVTVIANRIVYVRMTIDLVEEQLYLEFLQGSYNAEDETAPDAYHLMFLAVTIAGGLPVAFHKYDPDHDYPLTNVEAGTPIISYFDLKGLFIPTMAYCTMGMDVSFEDLMLIAQGTLPSSVHDWGMVEMMFTYGVLYGMRACTPLFLTGLYDEDESESMLVDVHQTTNAMDMYDMLPGVPSEFTSINFTLTSMRPSSVYLSDETLISSGRRDGSALCSAAAIYRQPDPSDPSTDYEVDYYVKATIKLDEDEIFVGNWDTSYEEWEAAYKAGKMLRFLDNDFLDNRDTVPVEKVDPCYSDTDYPQDIYIQGLYYNRPVFRFMLDNGDWVGFFDILPNSYIHNIYFSHSALIECNSNNTYSLGFDDDMLGKYWDNGDEAIGDLIFGDWLSSITDAMKHYNKTLYGAYNSFSHRQLPLLRARGNSVDNPWMQIEAGWEVTASGLAVEVSWDDNENEWAFERYYAASDYDAYPRRLGWSDEQDELTLLHNEVVAIIPNVNTLPINIDVADSDRCINGDVWPEPVFEAHAYIIVPSNLGNVTLEAGNIDFLVSGPTVLEAGKKYELHLMHRTLTVKELTIMSMDDSPFITSNSSDNDILEYLRAYTAELFGNNQSGVLYN